MADSPASPSGKERGGTQRAGGGEGRPRGGGVPEGVDARTAVQIERAVDESFVAGFRAVMLVSSGLALASTLVAALLIGDRRVQSTSRDPYPPDWRRAHSASAT